MRNRPAPLAWFLLFAALSACDGESEGQPCLVDSDCQSSFICKPSPNAPTTDGLRCCPMDNTKATTPSCTTTTAVGLDANSGVPDATAESATEAMAESAADSSPPGDAADATISPDATPPADAADAPSPSDAADGSSE